MRCMLYCPNKKLSKANDNDAKLKSQPERGVGASNDERVLDNPA